MGFHSLGVRFLGVGFSLFFGGVAAYQYVVHGTSSICMYCKCFLMLLTLGRNYLSVLLFSVARGDAPFRVAGFRSWLFVLSICSDCKDFSGMHVYTATVHNIPYPKWYSFVD